MSCLSGRFSFFPFPFFQLLVLEHTVCVQRDLMSRALVTFYHHQYHHLFTVFVLLILVHICSTYDSYGTCWLVLVSGTAFMTIRYRLYGIPTPFLFRHAHFVELFPVLLDAQTRLGTVDRSLSTVSCLMHSSLIHPPFRPRTLPEACAVWRGVRFGPRWALHTQGYLN